MKHAVGHPSRPRAGLVAGLLAALVIALSAPPRAMAVSTDNDCLVWAAKYTLVEQSKFSLVFSKFNPHVKSDGPTYYGCVFSREKARVLARQGEGGTLSQFELKGRYVAYADVFHDPAVAESSGRILVFDAADNKTKVDEPAWPDQPGLPGGERGFSDAVTSLVLKFDGSVAWIGRKSASGAADEFAVQRDDADGKRELDRSPDIAPVSLGLARDNVTIYWKKGGAPQTASLQ